ncbi:MAG: hypothetical protein QNK03_10455 [Myxococcota bacterium]|nr:hypothetical protein [Myxococcota bacterium]
MFWKLALRDTVILSAVVALWIALAERSGGSGPLADLLGVALGLGVGACAFLLHEWGHLLGGLALRSDVRAPASLGSVYLFSFDSKTNSRRQFLVMSFSGFAVTAAAITFAYGVLPDALLASRVARGAIVFLTSLTVFLEVPIVIVSLLRRSALPPVEVFKDHRTDSKAAA